MRRVEASGQSRLVLAQESEQSFALVVEAVTAVGQAFELLVAPFDATKKWQTGGAAGLGEPATRLTVRRADC